MAKNAAIYNFTLAKKSVNVLTAEARKALATAENSYFHAGVIITAIAGTTIPAFGDYPEFTLPDKKRVTAIAEEVGKAYPTVSRIIKAMRLLISNGQFEAVASGTVPFSFDKIIWYYDHQTDCFKDKALAEVVAMSTSDIKACFVTTGNTSNTNQSKDQHKAEKRNNKPSKKDVKKNPDRYAVWTYDGKEYRSLKSDIDTLIEKSILNTKLA